MLIIAQNKEIRLEVTQRTREIMRITENYRGARKCGTHGSRPLLLRMIRQQILNLPHVFISRNHDKQLSLLLRLG